MRFTAFYTSIYNIHLGFIKIESKTGREEARAKPAKKMGSSRRSGSPRQSRQWQEDKSRVRVGEQTFSYSSTPSPRWRGVGLLEMRHFCPFSSKISNPKQNKPQNATQTNQKNTFMEELGFY